MKKAFATTASVGTSTPWGGKTTLSRKYAPGIIWYNGKKKGGFKLSRKKFKEMPRPLRDLADPYDEWFEGDQSWAAVVVAYPHYFKQADIVKAHDVLKAKFPKAYEKYMESRKSA